jgi:hypothetical protein
MQKQRKKKVESLKRLENGALPENGALKKNKNTSKNKLKKKCKWFHNFSPENASIKSRNLLNQKRQQGKK